MGYFSSGTEGKDYQHRWCANCQHDIESDCRVWLAHLLYNGNAGEVLDLRIPRDTEGENLQCTMYLPTNGDNYTTTEGRSS